MNFAECVMHCFDDRELVSNFNRLTGCKLGVQPGVIERMIDQATGHEPPALNEADALAFIAFVWDCIWTRLPHEVFADPA